MVCLDCPGEIFYWDFSYLLASYYLNWNQEYSLHKGPIPKYCHKNIHKVSSQLIDFCLHINWSSKLYTSHISFISIHKKDKRKRGESTNTIYETAKRCACSLSFSGINAIVIFSHLHNSSLQICTNHLHISGICPDKHHQREGFQYFYAYGCKEGVHAHWVLVVSMQLSFFHISSISSLQICTNHLHISGIHSDNHHQKRDSTFFNAFECKECVHAHWFLVVSMWLPIFHISNISSLQICTDHLHSSDIHVDKHHKRERILPL